MSSSQPQPTSRKQGTSKGRPRRKNGKFNTIGSPEPEIEQQRAQHGKRATVSTLLIASSSRGRLAAVHRNVTAVDLLQGEVVTPVEEPVNQPIEARPHRQARRAVVRL